VLQEQLEQKFDEHNVDEVEFKQWTTTDRSTLSKEEMMAATQLLQEQLNR